jgi:hypothetical protein
MSSPSQLKRCGMAERFEKAIELSRMTSPPMVTLWQHTRGRLLVRIDAHQMVGELHLLRLGEWSVALCWGSPRALATHRNRRVDERENLHGRPRSHLIPEFRHSWSAGASAALDRHQFQRTANCLSRRERSERNRR